MQVRDVPLGAAPDALLLALERRVQVQQQAEANAALLRPAARAAPSLKDFLSASRAAPVSPSSRSADVDAAFAAFARQMDAGAARWRELHAHAHQSFALVEEMEASHAQVASKTQALYESFENVLQQVEALDARVEAIAKPMPHFIAIDAVAHALGFGVKFAPPSAASGVLTGSTTNMQQPAVQVFQHRRSVDPTTPAFDAALDKIDESVAFLTQHLDYKDSACYIDAYRSLLAGGIQCLRDYAINGLDAAKDAVSEGLQKLNARAQQDAAVRVNVELDETSPYYVDFQLVGPALSSVAKQLGRLRDNNAANVNAANLQTLDEVTTAYANQRVMLLSPVLSSWFEAISQTSDIVNVLRVSCTQLIRVCDAEFRLFLKLFGREPTDPLFSFHGASVEDDGGASSDDQDEDGNENAFERLIFQLSALMYNVVRPQILQQRDLETLCETIHVLRSEVIEGSIHPRAATVAFAEPVMQRMIQDAQERLILCVQKYIRDEIEGFTPEPADLDYPDKLISAAATGASIYATWYPALEHTLMCLSKVYHFVNMEIFEELAQDAIRICTVSLKMAAADVTAAKGELHGTLFLVKHLLTLREQITPFEISFSQTNKALDFTSTSDAMTNLLADVSTLFSFATLQQNRLFGLFSNAIPQIQETRSDVKKELEQELKKSCASFIEAVLQQVAQPLLSVMKQISAVQQQQQRIAPATKATALDFRQCSFTEPREVERTLMSVVKQLEERTPDIRGTIHVYLRNASTETILFKPVQRNLMDAIESLRALMEQTYTHEERAPCENAFALLSQQLRAL